MPADCIITRGGLSPERLAAVIGAATTTSDPETEQLHGLYQLPAITDQERRHGR